MRDFAIHENPNLFMTTMVKPGRISVCVQKSRSHLIYAFATSIEDLRLALMAGLIRGESGVCSFMR